MDDSRIVELYFDRDQTAVSETERKYGKYCFSIANRILGDSEDASECVNDTFLGAWNSIPPHKPENLRTFLGKITRRISLKKWREKTAQKRGGGNVEISIEELEECIPSGHSVDEALEIKELVNLINSFLETLPVNERRVFLRRYWYFDSIEDISERFGYGNSKVKMMLKRTRDKLLKHLNKEGVYL